MSRIGKKPVQIPAGVTVTIDGTTVSAKGSKGELTRTFSELVSIALDGDVLTVSRVDESKESNAQQGLVRTLIHNMVVGVSEGFEKKLELTGVGYRAALKGKDLDLSLGYSHPVIFACPDCPSFFSSSKCGMTTVSSCTMIDAVMYGMMPMAKIDSCSSAPPENRLISE